MWLVSPDGDNIINLDNVQNIRVLPNPESWRVVAFHVGGESLTIIKSGLSTEEEAKKYIAALKVALGDNVIG